jgi:hypothetical protein
LQGAIQEGKKMRTIKAKVLLGWMPENEALTLLDRCVFDPQLSHDEKIALWRKYRDRTALLPQEYDPLQLAKLSLLEKSNVTTFLNRLSGTPVRKMITKAVKFQNPGQLVIRQFYVVVGRMESHAAAITSKKQRINRCLGVGLDERQNIQEVRQGTTTILRLPHFEFEVKARPGGFDINEMGRWLSAVEDRGRFVVWGGYHRTHALLSQMTPDADGEAPLLILMKGVTEAELFFGADSDRPAVRDVLRAARPPLFKDFFDDNLFMVVDLLKQRREVHIEPLGLQIQAKLLYVDDV